MNATPADFIETARGYLGTPFHHAGRLPGVGLDCIGVIVCAAVACGLPFADAKAYPLRPNGLLRRALDLQFECVPSALPGDLLLMSFTGETHHVAIFTGAGIIHAYASVHKCVEQPMSDVWQKRTRGVYRFKEFALGGIGLCPAH